MTETTRDTLSRLILEQYRLGKRECFDVLVAAWVKQLYCYVRRLVENTEDAWDVMQDVWVRVFRGLGSVRHADALNSWLYKVARNAALEHIRRTPVWHSLVEEDAQTCSSAESDEPNLGIGFTALDIHRCLDRLPAEQREVLVLHFLEGFTHSEIASIAGVSEGAVRARAHRAKTNLRRMLEQEESQVEQAQR